MASAPKRWNYDDPPLTPLVSKLGNLANGLYSSHIKNAKAGIDRFFSLYLFILKNLSMRPEELRLLITSKGEPIFSLDAMKSLMSTINSQKSLPFAKRLLVNSQVGGQPKDISMSTMARAGLGSLTGIASRGVPEGLKSTVHTDIGSLAPASLTGSLTPNSLGTAASVTGQITSGEGGTPDDEADNPSTKKFWDVFFKRRVGNTLTSYVPTQEDKATPWIFALYGLERLESVGPLISTFLDTVTLQLPTVGELLGTGAGTLIQLAPIPYAGLVADGVAYAISLLFIMISSITSLSRKQFGTSFTVGLGAVPIIGDLLSDAALLFEKQYERYEFNKKRLLKSLEKVSPHMADFMDYWAPDVLPKTGPPVTLDTDKVIEDLTRKSLNIHGVEGTRALLTPNNIKAMSPEARSLIMNKSGGRRKTRRLKKRK
jgi:hypothetical protein